MKIKTVFRKYKQKMETKNENTNQTHPYFSFETLEVIVDLKTPATFMLTLTFFSKLLFKF